MKALVLAGGDSSRLPGPVPKPFRPLGSRPVIGHILVELEKLSWIDQIDVLVRQDQQTWASRALVGNYECDLVIQPTLGPAARVAAARTNAEPLVICLGDTVVDDHAYWIQQLVANRGPRARVLVDSTEAHWIADGGATEGLRATYAPGVIDVGSYYLPEGTHFYIDELGLKPERTILQTLLDGGPLDAVYHTRGVWHDVGTPEGFAAAELAMIGGKL